MPPILALLACFILFIFLLWWDYKQKPRVSLALWIPTIWVMLLGSRFVSQWLNFNFDVGSTDLFSEGSPIDRAVFSFLICCSIYILVRRTKGASIVLKGNGAILLFIFYCGFSILWSDFPFIAFKRWIKELGNILMIMVILTEEESKVAVKTVIRRTGYLMVPLSIVLIKYFPNLGRTYSEWTGVGMNTGVATSKNQLGTLCLVTGLYFSWHLIESWKERHKGIGGIGRFIDIIFLVMIGWIFKGLDSVTSSLCLLLGIVMLWIMRRGIVVENLKAFGIFIILFLLIGWVTDNSTNLSEKIIISLGRQPTLTDRVPMWKDLIEMSVNPFIGAGYETFFWGERLAIFSYKWHVELAHNGYLDTYLNLGWAGIILLCGLLVGSYRKFEREVRVNLDYGTFTMAFFFVTLTYNFSEVGFKGTSLIWFIFLLFSFGGLRLRNIIAEDEKKISGKLAL